MTARRPTRARVCVVLKRSSWRKWVEQEADPRVVALLEAGDETVRRMRPGHVDHIETVEEVRTALADLGAEVAWHERPHHFRIEGRCDLVVIVGGDGTLLAASHGVGPRVPLLGVNSAPDYSVGFFCAAKKGHVREALAAALDGTLDRIELARMRVELNGRSLHERVLNEALYCHASPAATSRYILRILGGGPAARVLGGTAGSDADRSDRSRTIAEEEQKSSGLWVGPAAGSTAAQKSAGGRVLPLDSTDLQYVVREPYRAYGEPPKMALGLVGEGETLLLKSRMRQARLFLDGDHLVHDVTIGDVVTMQQSREPLVVLGLKRADGGEQASGGAAARVLERHDGGRRALPDGLLSGQVG
jgi:NAD+ kinase